jgi:ribosomal protein S18 acetylase RimI-like enzyme
VGEDREQGLTLRLASAADAAVIADLVRLAFSTQSVPTNPPSSALKETPASVMRELEKGGGAVVASGSAMVGAVLWREEAGSLYVGRLAVHPSQRRRGIARLLMAEAGREARRRGLTRMHLGVRLPLADNRRLFLSCGFVDVELLSHEGFSEPTWVRMERRLT